MARRKYGKPGTRGRPQAKGGTARGALQFAVSPKKAVLKEIRKNFSTGGLVVAGNANSRRARQAGKR